MAGVRVRQRREQEPVHGLDMPGEDGREHLAARAGEGDHGAALVVRGRRAGDEAPLLEELRGDVQDATAYAETLRQVHETVGRAAHNAYLVDAITAVQGLSRRFWFAHLRDASSEIARGSALYGQGIAAVLDGDREGAERALLALNDYLVEFTRATLDEQGRGLG